MRDLPVSFVGCTALAVALLLLDAPDPAQAVAHSQRVDLVREYHSRALQGDLRSVRALLETIPPAERRSDERALEERFAARFERRDEVFPALGVSPFASDVVSAYRAYWTSVLLGELEAADGEARLWASLSAAFVHHHPDVPRPAASEALETVQRALEREGLHVAAGVTLPFYDLMLWRQEESKTYDCQLTERVQPVEVVFLSDFVVHGWAHFATFGRSYTGGWATKEKLYCLRDDYDLESERFHVSYLRHEARHFADYRLFPSLEQIDLEYRAKLTELVYAETSLFELIETFASNGAPNPAAPHAFANRCTVRDLSRELFDEETFDGSDPRWRELDAELVHGAAALLLERHTKALVAAGADTTRGILRSD